MKAFVSIVIAIAIVIAIFAVVWRLNNGKR